MVDPVSVFNKYLRTQGLKSTRQRLIILETFLDSKSHYSTEELYQVLRKDHPRIGYATVHRTLKLFAECGIATELNFGDGQARFEPHYSEHHHDHLVCTRCGKIIEFVEPRIEQLQREIAERYDFSVESHRHELYGHCIRCSQNS